MIHSEKIDNHCFQEHLSINLFNSDLQDKIMYPSPAQYGEISSKRAFPQPYQPSDWQQIGSKRLNPQAIENSENNNLQKRQKIHQAGSNGFKQACFEKPQACNPLKEIKTAKKHQIFQSAEEGVLKANESQLSRNYGDQALFNNSQIFNQQATPNQIDFESKAQQRLKEVLDTSRDDDEEECEYDYEDLVSSEPQNPE